MADRRWTDPARAALAAGIVASVAAGLAAAVLAGTGAAALLTVAILAGGAIAAWGAVRLTREDAAEAQLAHRAAADLADGSRVARAELATRDAVLSAMSEGVVVFAPTGEVAYANPAARTLLGRRFDTTTEVTPKELRDAVLRAAAAGPGDGPFEEPVETVDRSVAATAIPTTPAGTVVLVARDVTGAKRVERLRRDFVANASHELKTPVASILALADSLRRAVVDDPAAADHFVGRLEHEAARLSRLVADLLDLSRLEGQVPEAADVRFDRVVGAEVERLRPRAESASVRLRVDRLTPAVVVGSEPDLALLVHNLLDNAVRFTPEGGDVRVGVAMDGDVTLEVDDTGIGIPSRDLDRIFERFYRVDPARSRETGGTGLGLSIVRNIAEAHGGEVRVRSVLGAGSTFVVRLPATAGPSSE